MKRQRFVSATQFKAELWTRVYPPRGEGYELWAVIMLDGSEANFPCAFGSRNLMEQYASQLNESKGVLA